jgi:hypothetical protein
LEAESCAEGISGEFGSSGNRSSGMVYSMINA